MSEEQAEKMLESLDKIDWKLWEIMKMMKEVLGQEEDNSNDSDEN